MHTKKNPLDFQLLTVDVHYCPTMQCKEEMKEQHTAVNLQKL